MKIEVFAFVILLSGCVSVQDVQSKRVAFSGDSPRAVDAIAGCITNLLRSGPGVIVSSTPLENGVSLVQSINGQFGNTVFTVADIVRTNNRSFVVVKGVGRMPKEPAKAYAPYQACLDG